ncbi:ABC transporter permease subunit [Halocatena marina]|uniref:ABC transporter permease subunit n=1 Tax=Halocatena marina TaxID=2934937 RepID=A0ABD5YYX9_9EURY
MVSAGWSAALPILTGFVLGISGLGMRGNAVRIMESDYIRVARLRGLSQSRIASRYLARNAILPLYTGFMIGIAGIFGSGIITERIFSYPAVGWYTFAAQKRATIRCSWGRSSSTRRSRLQG